MDQSAKKRYIVSASMEDFSLDETALQHLKEGCMYIHIYNWG